MRVVYRFILWIPLITGAVFAVGAPPVCADPRLAKIIARVDPSDPEKLCEAQYSLMLIAKGAFDLNTESLQRPIVEFLTRMLQKTVPLSIVDQRPAYMKDEFLRRFDLSGSDRSRRIFLFRVQSAIPGVRRILPNITVPRLMEQPLCQLQFSYLVSYVLRRVSENNSVGKETYAAFSTEAWSFLLNDLVVPYWRSVAAWHWVGYFPNTGEAVRARLAWQEDPKLRSPSYHRAFYDMDFFTMAIAADLLAVARSSHRLKIDAPSEQVLTEIRDATRSMWVARSAAEGPFRFQQGVWADHPEFAHAGCSNTDTLPPAPCPQIDVAPDSNHAERISWWLESFEVSWDLQSPQAAYFRNQRIRLARTFTESLVDYDHRNRPRLRNFLDGRNGWYRVGYNGRAWGFGPYSLTYIAKWGSWSTLAPLDPGVKLFHQRMCALVSSVSDEDRRFRTKYFGNPVQPGPAGFGTEDDMTPGSQYELYCDLLKQLGYR